MYFNKTPEYFLTVASEGSFSKAAEKLFISQPYLSQHVIRLEEAFGVRLLDRRRTPLQLTEAGRVYANYLESSAQLYQKLLGDFATINASREQTLRIGLSNWRAGTLLPDVLPEYGARCPQVRLDVQERPTNELYRLVSDGEVDLAVMNTSLETPGTITLETIVYERILLVGNRRNPATQALLEQQKQRGRLDLHPLEGERFILMRPEIFLSARVLNYLDKEQVVLRNVTYGTNTTTALNLTAQNYGFCFVNETGIRTAPNRGDLVFFDLDTPDMVHPLCALYKKNSYLRPIARTFIDVTIAFYRSLYDGAARESAPAD